MRVRVQMLKSTLSEPSNLTERYCCESQERLAFLQRGSSSFFLFLPDFTLVYDGRKDLLGFCCPLSWFFEVRPSDLCFDDLIDDYNVAQIHFIVRRLVQVAGLSWEWDCLAKF